MPKLWIWLSQPALLLSNQEKFWIHLATGAFLFFFMVFFQPFGVNNYDPNETISWTFVIYMIMFTVYVTLILLFNDFVIFRLVTQKLVTRGHMILWIMWTLFYAATAIFLFYNWLGNWHDFSLVSWLGFIGNIGTIALFPLAGVFIYVRMKQLQECSQTDQNYHHDASNLIRLPSDNQKDELVISLDSILYIESQDNYVAIHHLDQNKPTKTLLRITLKKLDEAALHPALYRCHRSFIVNLLHLNKFNGNSQQGLISLHHTDIQLPVSRSYASELINRLS